MICGMVSHILIVVCFAEHDDQRSEQIGGFNTCNEQQANTYR